MESFIDAALCKNCIHYQNGTCGKDDVKKMADIDGINTETIMSSSMEDRVSVSPEGTCATFTEKAEHEKETDKEKLIEIYYKINFIIEKYMDIPEENKIFISLWIIGTHLHEEFEAYPYLFLNAMRGSGKTRLLKIISALSANGQMLASLRESTLFRTTGTLCIDEFEGVGKKDKNELRELLNAGYKKGIGVIRMKKTRKKIMNEEGKEQTEETQEAEFFDPYRPIAMANIWGMEEVLQDRCISLTLEKSDNPLFIKLIEDFAQNSDFLEIKELFKLYLGVFSVVKKNIDTNPITPNLGTLDVNGQNKCRLCRFGTAKNIYTDWNNFILSKYKVSTLTTLHTLTTLTTLTTLFDGKKEKNDDKEFFSKIEESGIDGRHLELLMPLFFISKEIGDELFNKVLLISKKVTEERKEDEMCESKDVALFDYVSRQEEIDWHSLTGLVAGFRNFTGEESEREDMWLNEKWMGRALKRLNLIIDRRRLNTGREITLNIKKAEEKLKIFRNKPKDKVSKLEVIKV